MDKYEALKEFKKLPKLNDFSIVLSNDEDDNVVEVERRGKSSWFFLKYYSRENMFSGKVLYTISLQGGRNVIEYVMKKFKSEIIEFKISNRKFSYSEIDKLSDETLKEIYGQDIYDDYLEYNNTWMKSTDVPVLGYTFSDYLLNNTKLLKDSVE